MSWQQAWQQALGHLLPRGLVRARRSSRSRSVAFTIVEMLIAVVAVGLIGVGLARLFAATGDTVRIGRRTSVLNEYASLIERTLRQDISKMSRKGFLVIRHRETGGSATNTAKGVLLHADQDPKLDVHRRRRIDEMVFFQEGTFTSLRDVVDPRRQATGSAARIYYGHGLRADLTSTSGNPRAVKLDDGRTTPVAVAAFGEKLPNGSPGPNEFASSWILLRHATVLAAPQASFDPAALSPALPSDYKDSLRQVGFQPAAPDLFRNILTQTSASLRSGGVRGDSVLPVFESGAVDVAAVDLSYVRARVLNARDPATLPTGTRDKDTDFPIIPFVRDTSSFEMLSPVDTTGPTDPNGATNRMKQWMIQAFPAGPEVGRETDLVGPGNPERRMRCEIEPPDLLGNSALGARSVGATEYQRADQAMLSASNFVPGCTEFIIEWSFGQTYPSTAPANLANRVAWHGRERMSSETNERVAAPYGLEPIFDKYSVSYRRTDGTTATRPLLVDLVHLPDPTLAIDPDAPLYSCFGFTDPTYQKRTGTAGAADPDTVPWAWPKLLRITMSIVDPSDPGLEQTFQFVIDVPSGESGVN